MYSTQKKRVAFNVSKMLSGAGAEGEVGQRWLSPLQSVSRGVGGLGSPVSCGQITFSATPGPQ